MAAIVSQMSLTKVTDGRSLGRPLCCSSLTGRFGHARSSRGVACLNLWPRRSRLFMRWLLASLGQIGAVEILRGSGSAGFSVSELGRVESAFWRFWVGKKLSKKPHNCHFVSAFVALCRHRPEKNLDGFPTRNGGGGATGAGRLFGECKLRREKGDSDRDGSHEGCPMVRFQLF
jgi:hypothetical protein